jgi:predicted dehydrogenase
MTADSQTPTEVAIIGMGNVSGAYLRTLDDLASRGTARHGAMCCRNRDQWPGLLARRPGLQLVATVDEVLDSAAEVVVILTAPDSHAELARSAIARGKHVVVEKPLALSVSDGQSVIGAARAAQVNVLVAPFVTLSATFQQLAALVDSGAIGMVHSARAMYGNLGSDWAGWYHEGVVGPLAEVGIYNLQSLTALLGPVAAVQAAGTIGMPERRIGETRVVARYPDTTHVILHHVSGAISSVLASHAVSHYRRPALELYGSAGTAYLQGDDWDPTAIDVWRTDAGRWERYETIDRTWHWTDGLREAVVSLREGRPPVTDPEQDIHLLEILGAAETAGAGATRVDVRSRFVTRRTTPNPVQARKHVHDHTRSPTDQ